MRRVGHHDEELAARAVGDHCACHGENAQRVLEIVLEAVGGKFALDLVTGAARAVAVRVAALDHKTGDNAVKHHTIVKAGIRQRDEVVDGVGRKLGIELTAHHRAAFHFNGHNRICHLSSPYLRAFIARSISRFASRLAASSRLS